MWKSFILRSGFQQLYHCYRRKISSATFQAKKNRIKEGDDGKTCFELNSFYAIQIVMKLVRGGWTRAELHHGLIFHALNKSGYKYNLSYKAPTPNAPRKSKNRQRNITWFNPSYSQNVETKVGKCFLQLIDKHFPKSNPLHKIFNRNTLKLSYSCMSNVKTIISSHNKAQIKKSIKSIRRNR